MGDTEGLIFKHGGYRNLKSFQVARLVYDLTVQFCENHIDRFSRTRDQMVHAARSGVQNIAEGSEAAATSKKTEIKLTQVARASLEELRLDYEDYLRQHNFLEWERNHPLRQELIDHRFGSASEVLRWITSRSLSTSSTKSILSTAEISANSVLVLILVACSLLDRQVASLARNFEEEGGFTERIYRMRKERRGR